MNFISHPPNDVAEWAQSAGATGVLLRSRVEIANLFGIAIDTAVPLVIVLEKIDKLFIARLLGIEPEEGYATMAYSDVKGANKGLLEAGKGVAGFNYKNSHIEFMVANAIEHFDRGPAVRFDFPDALYVQQRRSSHRVAVIPHVPLACLVDGDGIMPFFADIVDIGIGGLGAMVYAHDIKLKPGTILRGCKITLPDLRVATVDILVRGVGKKVEFRGQSCYRVACSFVGTEETIAKLIEVFLLDLDPRGTAA